MLHLTLIVKRCQISGDVCSGRPGQVAFGVPACYRAWTFVGAFPVAWPGSLSAPMHINSPEYRPLKSGTVAKSSFREVVLRQLWSRCSRPRQKNESTVPLGR
jgi:hypothetical protein